MTPYEFQQKWIPSTLRERAASQEHFIDLCRMLGEATPAEADPHGRFYTFDKKISKSRGGDGFADVWKRGHFGWEYKGKHRDLHAAFGQLRDYAPDLENPPLLVVSDMDLIRIHTNFTNAVQQIHEITLDDIVRPEKLTLLKNLFSNPEALRPGISRETLTADAANRLASLAEALRNRDFDPQRVAHFITRLLFCLFAEDIGLLPEHLFTRLLEASRRDPTRFSVHASRLFETMRTGGHFDLSDIEWFNGGLFDDSDAIPLTVPDIQVLLDCARLDWSAIEPSIMGTLFERGLDAAKRSQLGAHYTDPGSIMRIVEPVVLRPLREQWAEVRGRIERTLATASKKRFTLAEGFYKEYLASLRATRVLDPACGSGNFLYLALRGLKDLELQVMDEAARLLRIPMEFPEVGPANMLGIELNLYAAELARVTLWIGQIQWMIHHNLGLNSRPILQSLNQIECRDALLTETGAEASWPSATCIVGNPPFLGDKKILSALGDDYVKHLRRTFEGRVPGGADYVTYWFEKARWQIEQGHTGRAGLVATNSIRGGQNRRILERITATQFIFEAWSDEPWILDGAAVRVSIVCFSKRPEQAILDGSVAPLILPTLTAGLDLTSVHRLPSNCSCAFQGPVKVGPFDIPGDLARTWLLLPGNPNGKPNSDVLKPWCNGMDLTRRPSGRWIVDFGSRMLELEAALYEAPFEYVRSEVKPLRDRNRDAQRRTRWWLLGRTGEDMRAALLSKSRYIATPRVAKHRLFVWLRPTVVPDCQLVVIARDDDTTFGILHSRFHELWALRLCTWLGVGNDPRYTPTSTFETFPFPEGLTPSNPASEYASAPRAQAIAEAARELNTLRENWLNPPDLVHRVPEVVPGFPDRILPNDEKAAEILKKRTLTNLYNQRPAWLQHAHQRLDAAVAAAYGWPPDLSDDEILSRLLALNLSRSPAVTPSRA